MSSRGNSEQPDVSMNEEDLLLEGGDEHAVDFSPEDEDELLMSSTNGQNEDDNGATEGANVDEEQEAMEGDDAGNGYEDSHGDEVEVLSDAHVPSDPAQEDDDEMNTDLDDLEDSEMNGNGDDGAELEDAYGRIVADLVAAGRMRDAAEADDIANPMPQFASPRRIGTRSRAKRNDTPHSDEQEDDEEDGGSEGKNGEGEHHSNLLQAPSQVGVIRIGGDYQAATPECVPKERARNDEDRDTAMWVPPEEGVDEDGLMEFCEVAVGVYMMSFDRALYILQKCDYDFKKALDTVATRRIIRDEWTDDDNLLYRQAFCLYGKNFARIKQTMPHRSMSSIINHYYTTKKQQDYKSLGIQPNEQGSTKVHNTFGFATDEFDDFLGGKCENCGEQVDTLLMVDESKQCNTCYLYYKLMLKPRPCSPDTVNTTQSKRGVKVPPEFMEVVDEFMALAEQLPEDKIAKKSSENGLTKIEGKHQNVCVFRANQTKAHQRILKSEEDIGKLKARIFRLECVTKQQKLELDPSLINELRPKVMKDGKFIKEEEEKGGRGRMQYTWTEQEKITAFHCFVRYGRDFDAVADILGTKTPDMVKSFYSDLKADIDKIIEDADEFDSQAIENDPQEREELIKLERPLRVVE